jgi:hypothetical protein
MSMNVSTISIQYLKKVKSVLNSWIHRELPYVGKITVIIIVALPILTQVISVLSNPPKETFIDIQTIVFETKTFPVHSNNFQSLVISVPLLPSYS